MCWFNFFSSENENRINTNIYHKILHDIRNFRVLNSTQIIQVQQMTEKEKLDLIFAYNLALESILILLEKP